MKNNLSHIDESGNILMDDVTNKEATARQAKASGNVYLPAIVLKELQKHHFLTAKGSIILTAQIAGIQAVKKTSELIPLCHQLATSKISVDILPLDDGLKITCEVSCVGQTGVEMEALTGVSIAALTIYDMCKALSHDIKIHNIQLDKKRGGKNDFSR